MKLTTARSLYPAMFSTARLMRVAIKPVKRPTRQASDHFKKIYCNTCTLDLLLQSCLNRSFSLILQKGKSPDQFSVNILRRDYNKEKKKILKFYLLII